jgi:phage N-6-adenine-methyltransferase
VDESTRKAMFSSETDDWATPQKLFDGLNEIYHFTVDVCATPENAKCAKYFTKEDNGLAQAWTGTAWMNPPYGNPEYVCKKNCKKKRCVKRGSHCLAYKPGIREWIKKAVDTAKSGTAEVVCLLPVRADSKWFHTHVWDNELAQFREGVFVQFLPGRLHFGGARNPAPFPSMIVMFQKKAM